MYSNLILLGSTGSIGTQSLDVVKKYNINVVALFSGVCKVNAAIAAQILIDTYKVDAIINAGTAGGLYDCHAAYFHLGGEIKPCGNCCFRHGG